MKIKLCFVTKAIFYLDEEIFITNSFLGYEDVGFLGFEKEEIEKMVFIGFKEEKKFDGYLYNFGKKHNVFIIGPKFKKEQKYILDRILNIARILKEIWENRKILKDIDLVFSAFFEYLPFIFVFLKIISSKPKFIVYFIGDYPELNYQKRKNIFLKLFLLISQKICQFISEESWFLSEYLMKKYGDKKSVLIRSSFLREYEIGNPKSLDKNFLNLLFVGRIEEEKNPHIPIEIFEILKREGVKVNLSIVGDGSLKEDLIKKVNLKNHENIKFTGWLKDRQELFKIYSASHLLIFPSKKGEGLGLVILEAMSQGTVVISSRSGGPEEIIRNGENGFLIDIDKEKKFVEEAVNKIKFLISHPEIYSKISKKAVETAKEFTLEKFIKIQKERISSLIIKNQP